MNKSLIKKSKWLYPASWLYGVGVGLRNLLFDRGYLQERSFDLPVICIGNITVGGTGKTPVCLALAKLLSDQQRSPWFLNHGYRATQQSVLVDTKAHTALDVGDEALLLAESAPTIVDSARARGAQLAEKMNACVGLRICNTAWME